jgi:RNA polymerase sigma-70 factor (ECF subfamily)
MQPNPGPNRAADEARFTALFEGSYAAVRRFVERRTQVGSVDDVVAETFLVAWRRRGDLPSDDRQVQAWLYATARNVLRNDARRGRRQQAIAVQMAEAASRDLAHTADIDAAVSRLDLGRAWRCLSAVHQEAIALSVWEGLSAPEAAMVLDISPVAYRLRLSRARRALRIHTGMAHVVSQPPDEPSPGHRAPAEAAPITSLRSPS